MPLLLRLVGVVVKVNQLPHLQAVVLGVAVHLDKIHLLLLALPLNPTLAVLLVMVIMAEQDQIPDHHTLAVDHVVEVVAQMRLVEMAHHQ